MKSRIARLFEFIDFLLGRSDELELHVSHVYGRSCKMAIERPPLNLTDTDKCRLRVRDDTKGPFTWSSSDPSQVGIEAEGDGKTAMCTTPLSAGEATITVSAKGYEDETMLVNYVDSTPGELGLSADTPEPD